jgi:hypothetical protein
MLKMDLTILRNKEGKYGRKFFLFINKNVLPCFDKDT